MLKRIISLFILLYFPLANAYLEIEITQGIDAAMPIAVVPFQGADLLPPDLNVSDVVHADLERSGEFKLFAERNMAQQPSQVEQVEYAYWRNLGLEALVIGEVAAMTGNRYRVRFAVLDLFVKNASTPPSPLLVREFTVDRQDLRHLAHHISDLVYQKLTGFPGAFSSRIAYVGLQWINGKPGQYRLEIADADGYNPQTILRGKEPIMSPAWSPNGKKLAYVSFENHRSEIYIADVASGQREKVSHSPGINGAPAWSPDGRKLALVLSNENVPKIYILDLATDKLTQVTSGTSIDTEPFWLDSNHLLFTSNRGGQPQIYKVNLGNKQVQRMTFTGDYNARASVTPNGEYMVMIHRNQGRYHIAAQNLKNNHILILTETSMDESPSLAPNGRMVIYGTVDRNKRVLSAVSIDGRVKLRIPTQDGDVQEPAWSPLLM
ncbi:MAG TPA: Tol-Pal system beta propeller repeat protein TolB, partial [Gammaproteobacteria bacterium]|nr:Tol-Pal system beta propeller repeat protein TolB [Gammaproteobacteria bacterium]